MSRKRMDGIKKYGLFAMMLTKRLFLRSSFLICLLAIPISILCLKQTIQKGETQIVGAVYIQPDSDGRIDEYRQELSERLLAQKGMVQFHICDTEDDLRKQVLLGKAECGYILQEDLQKRIEENDIEGMITVLQSPSSILTDTVSEVFYAQLFQNMSKEWYAGYIAKSPLFEMEYGIEEEKGRTEGKEETEIVEQIEHALENRLTDNSTFTVRYETIEGKAAAQKADITVFRGVTGLFVFLCGLLGGLDWQEDRQKKRFTKLFSKTGSGMAVIAAPVFWASVTAYGSMLLAGMFADVHAGKEAGRLLLFAGVVIVYCYVLAAIFRDKRQMTAGIPILWMGSIICCPIFLDLGQWIPVFRILEKLFPITYYMKGIR